MARNLNYRNARLAAISFAVAGVMVGASFAAVPLYRAFCQATGFAGTPKIAESAPEKMLERKIVVRFNADVDKSLAWKFAAVEDSIELRVGETRLAFYRAENLSGRAITGTATFNVTPLKAAQYFNKIDCFCFTEQRLEAGAAADMPVSFFIDPAIANDPNLSEVTTITLSYMFYESGDDADRNLRASKTPTETDG